MNKLIKPAVFLSYFLFAILLNSVGTLILQAQVEYSVGQAQASILEAFKDISIAITSFVAASIVGFFGKRTTLQISIALVGGFSIMLPSIINFNSMKLLLAMTGMSFALTKIIVFSTLGSLYKDKKRHASGMIFLEAFFMVGVLFGYWLFGEFLKSQSYHWSSAFYIIGALSLVSLAISPSIENQKEPSHSVFDDYINLVKLAIKPLTVVFISCVFFYVLIEQSIMSWLPSYNNTVLNLSTALSVQMGMILAAATALGRVVGGIAIKRVHWFTLIAFCLFGAIGLVLSTLAITPEPPSQPLSSWVQAPLAAYLFPCIGFFLAPIYPALNSTLLTATPSSQHTKMASLIVLFSALGGTSGSAITGRLFEIVGADTAFYFSIIPLLLLLLSAYGFYRKTK